MSIKILHGDCRKVLPELPDGSVQCCVTSPPYFGLRDYGHPGQLGLEQTPDEYIAAMVDVFRRVRDVLADDGTLWLNIGDSYAGSWGNQGRKAERGTQRPVNGEMMQPVHDGRYPTTGAGTGSLDKTPGCKNKDLIGIPWMLAFALRADGRYLRQDIIWHKPNPMPESVRDRCTKAHEYVFLLAKSERYYFDSDAMQEPACGEARGGGKKAAGAGHGNLHLSGAIAYDTRNKLSVWTVATKPYAGAHFATMAPELAETCIKAGCPEGGTVLDPFGGAGTTGLVADRLGRNALLVELSEDYAQLAADHIKDDSSLFAEVTQ